MNQPIHLLKSGLLKPGLSKLGLLKPDKLRSLHLMCDQAKYLSSLKQKSGPKLRTGWSPTPFSYRSNNGHLRSIMDIVCPESTPSSLTADLVQFC